MEINKSYYIDFHFKLGKIVVNYNLIEANIISLICTLTDLNNITVGFRKCSRKSSSQLLKMLKDLIYLKVRDEDILEKFQILYNHIAEIMEYRNSFIHSIYLDSTNKKFKLNSELIRVRKIKLREFDKGKNQINSEILYGLDGMDNLINILNDIYEESNKFFGSLSNEIPVKQTVFTIPDEPDFIKEMNK